MTMLDKSTTPARWYSVSCIGAATLCVDERDARHTAKQCDMEWPDGAPHRAVLMGDVDAEQERMRAINAALLDIAIRVEAMLTRQNWLPSDAPESALLREARAAIALATGEAK